MTDATGERFIPEEMAGELIEAEHQARYRLAGQLASGRLVLDAGCGVGWGTGLLLDAGATSAVGIDIARDAVEDGARRVPRGNFVTCDLQHLPFRGSSFELVTCFEAIEHVADPSRALDELTRVVAPEGLLMVSSPNPRVYPNGNPFHVHEFTPEELESALASRFGSAALWRQYDLSASCLVDGHALPSFHPTPTVMRAVIDLPEGDHDLYSVVVATSAAMPAFEGIVMLAPQTALRYTTAVNEDLRRANTALVERVHALEEVASDREARLQDAHHEISRLRRELHELRNSTSWRVTAPLRRISAGLSSRRDRGIGGAA